MSYKRDCYDNVDSQAIFATLKLELVYPYFFVTRLEACSEVFEYIVLFYNRQRFHSALNYMSPL